MKNIILVMAVLAFISRAQVPPGTYTNSSPATTPGNPGLNSPPYNPANPTGVPNQIDPYPVTPSPGTLINDSPTSPAPTITPSVPSPTSPTAFPPNRFNHLFQDPSRTPSYPNQGDPVRLPSGSTGKYKHKHVTGKKFGKSYHKMKTARPRHSDDSKTSSPPPLKKG